MINVEAERRDGASCAQRSPDGRAIAALTMITTLIACTEVPTQRAERSFTSTIAVGNERVLMVDVPISIAIFGESRSTEIIARVDATITASTSTRAKQLAEELAFIHESTDGGRVLTLRLPAPTDAGIGGKIDLGIPADFDLVVRAPGGTTDVDGVEGDLNIQSAGHVRVTDAQQNVDIVTTQGNVLLDTRLAPGTTTALLLAVGDVGLTVPAGLSADIQALAIRRGGVFPSHPKLPPFFGKAGDTYRANVGGGLSTVRVTTGAGNIVIRGP